MKWRPRKNQFERLDGDDADDETESFSIINRAFSVESETCEYRRDLLFDQKKMAFESHKKKRDLRSITIKPSVRDKNNTRTLSTRTKRAKGKLADAFDDPFGFEPFRSNHHKKSDESVDDCASRQTSSTHNTEFQTVKSDPSDFFSKPPNKLTKRNLDLISSMSEANATTSSNGGIENINRRGRFHQFTIEEDKESTVIDPVVYPGDETIIDSDDEQPLEEDSQYSIGYTSKGTLIQKGGPRVRKQNVIDEFERRFFASFERSKDIDYVGERERSHLKFEHSFLSENTGRDRKGDLFDAIRVAGASEPNGVTKKLNRPDPSQHFQSTQSLAYSESSGEDLNDTAFTEQPPQFGFIDMKNMSKKEAHKNQRTPLSPLNYAHQFKSRSNKNLPEKRQPLSHVVMDSDPRPDPDASWTTFPRSFEKKPDPKGDDAKTLAASTSLNNAFYDGSCLEKSEDDALNTSNTIVPMTKMSESESRTANGVNENNYKKTKKDLEHEELALGQNGCEEDNLSGRRIVSIPEDRTIDEEDDIDDDNLEYEYGYRKSREWAAEKPIGIQSFPQENESNLYSASWSQGSSHRKPKSLHSSSMHDRSRSSHSRSQYDNSLNSNKRRKSEYGNLGDQDAKSLSSLSVRNKALEFQGFSVEDFAGNDQQSMEKFSTSSASFTKPLGVPNNAIMASMLFRRHHNIDSHMVEEKLKAQEQEHESDRNRGDIPQSINAIDRVSCVSSFSEDTAAQIAAWRKPTRDLLDHFSRSRKTEYDFKKSIQGQMAQETELFEA